MRHALDRLLGLFILDEHALVSVWGLAVSGRYQSGLSLLLARSFIVLILQSSGLSSVLDRKMIAFHGWATKIWSPEQKQMRRSFLSSSSGVGNLLLNSLIEVAQVCKA